MSTQSRGGVQPKAPCTWEELSKHNTDNDCWLAVNGKVYDVTSWIDKHPGGRDMLVLAAGRDATNLFESYHPLNDKASTILNKYYVCDMSTCEFPRYVVKSEFYATLNKRVREYFEKTGKNPKNCADMWGRYVFVIAGLILSYYGLFFYASSKLSVVMFTLIFGLFNALISMHVMHDASHCSITSIPAVWRWMGATSDLMVGASFFAWLHQHVIGHHLYTNVRGADPDLGDGDYDFRVVAPGQRKFWIHQYQHYYAPLLYGLLSIKYRIQDKDNFTVRMNGRIRVEQPTLHDFITFVVGKIIYFITRFGVPLSRGWGVPSTLAAWFCYEMVMGYYLAFNFQVSHVAEELTFLLRPDATPIDDDWAKLQVLTTQDYGHGNWLTTFLSGGLNYQVVHHLYPAINQSYYPEIAPLVLQTCKEFGVQYQVLPTFTAAFLSHIDYLRKMGTPKPTKGD